MHTPFTGEGPNGLRIDAHRVGTETPVEYRVSWLQAFGVTDRSTFVDTVMITSQSQPFTDIGNPFSTPYPTSGYEKRTSPMRILTCKRRLMAVNSRRKSALLPGGAIGYRTHLFQRAIHHPNLKVSYQLPYNDIPIANDHNCVFLI